MPTHDTDRPRILVVNDDPASLMALVSLLAQWQDETGYELMTARSGEEALRHVLQHDFAVILLDVNMPGMNGFETAEAIHLRPRSSTIPIIFVTAYLSDDMNRLKGYQKGAVDYLFTPIIAQILHAKVAVFVGLARKNLELKKQTLELNRRTEELTASNVSLEKEMRERQLAVQQNRAKDEFLAMLGHELRNPLSAITSAASLIGVQGVSGEAQQRAKTIIARQSRHLGRIVDDLLDLSRALSGKILLSQKPLELSRLVQTCIDTLKTTGRTDHYDLQIDMQAAWVDADATRLEQIVTNLLDNAFKYTTSGGRVAVAIDIDDEAVLLTVRDSGLGIEAELLPHVFEVFVQGENSLDRAKGGLGIGLALVRQLVELHGGSVRADSDGRGCGSVFSVRLPRVEAAVSEALAPSVPLVRACRVLLVEDNEDGREMMSMMLGMHGLQIVTAEDGHQGLAQAALQRPDVALIDIGLPGIDGYEVARRLRADPETAGIKLIALTGYGLAEEQRLALAAGFDMHLVKPVDIGQLLTTIAHFVAPGATLQIGT